MSSRLQRRTVVGVVVIVALGFMAAAIVLSARGIDGSDILPSLILVMLTTAAASALAVALYLRNPARTIGWLGRAMEAMAAGSFDQRVPDFDRTEVGDLAASFNQMARALRTAFAEVEAERYRFVALMDATINGVIALDRQLHFRYLNPAAERMLGVRLEDALGKPFLYAVRDPDLHERLLRVRETHQHDVTVQRIGPEHRDVQVLLMPLAAGDWAFFIVMSDFTELRRLESIRRDFVSNVSHEIRTPLAALRAAVETLQAGAYEDPKAAPQFFERIVDEVDRLTNLVDELLALSRIEAQAPAMAADEAVNLGDIARETADRLSPQAGRARVALDAEADPSGPLITGDREQLRRAVTNLVDNAIKFTPAGGSVTIATAKEDGRASIAVRDTGIGMTREEQEHIFERFFKADRARSREGSGLGLAIVKHIVQAHGGEVTVESAPGKGTTFRCLFPLPAEREPASAEPQPSSSA